MSLDFTKVTTGQTLNFAKDFGKSVTGGVISFNLNWGKINGRSVDLDAYCITKSSGGEKTVTRQVVQEKAGFLSKMFGGKDTVSEVTETVRSTAGIKEQIYFGNLNSTGIKHHGDDLTGAWAKGEYIEVNLDKLPAAIDELVFGVSSFSGHSFSDLPFASIEVFTGTPKRQEEGLVSYELKEFDRGVMSAVLAVLKRNSAGEWEITAMKETSRSRNDVKAIARSL